MQSGAWTRILWVMPLVFVVLNTPFYVIMMVEVVSQVLYDKDADLMDRSQLFVVWRLLFPADYAYLGCLQRSPLFILSQFGH